MAKSADRKKRESEQDGDGSDRDGNEPGAEPVQPDSQGGQQDNKAVPGAGARQAGVPPPPPPPPQSPQSRDPATELRRLLDEKTKLADEYLNSLRYLQAEFDNYKKWAERDKSEFTKVANERLVRAVLPVLDNLEKAVESGKKEHTPFVDGIEMIYNELLAALKSVGLKEMKSLGTKFDPYSQEAMLTEARTDAEEDTVVGELQKGYLLNDKVIRTAKVRIAKKPEEKSDGTGAGEQKDDGEGAAGGK